MPSREDEYWASQKERNLKYCYKHKRYYKADIGCQICFLEKLSTKDEIITNREEIALIKCPRCLEMSLFWTEQRNIYECMNIRCQWIFTKEELEVEIKQKESEPKGKAWFGNEYFSPKKKKWRKP